MKKIIIKIALLTSFVLPVSANAGFLTTLVDAMTSTVDSTSSVSIEMLDLFAALADDIGEMADRILIMSDKILVMADKIVATEQLMATMALDIADIKNANTVATTPVIITAIGSTTLGYFDEPDFSISQTTSEYLVYVSSSLAMNTNTMSVLVHNNAELAAMWKDLNNLAVLNKIYIAVKTIEGNTISSLSNVLAYIQY